MLAACGGLLVFASAAAAQLACRAAWSQFGTAVRPSLPGWRLAVVLTSLTGCGANPLPSQPPSTAPTPSAGEAWLPHVPQIGLRPLPTTLAAPNDGLHALSWGGLFGSALLALASVLCAVVLPAVLGAARCLAAGGQLGMLLAGVGWWRSVASVGEVVVCSLARVRWWRSVVSGGQQVRTVCPSVGLPAS